MKYNTNKHALLSKNTIKHKINTNKTKATFSRLLRHPGMETEWDYSGRMGRDEKQEDRWSMNKKGKKGKDTEEGGEVTG